MNMKRFSTIGVCLLLMCAHQAQSQSPSRADESAKLLQAARDYYEGRSGPPNQSRAFQLFQQASQENSLEAKARLGWMYLTGRGTAMDQARGLALLQDATASNNAVALRLTGVAYQNGLGVAQDYEQARSYYERAISLKDDNANGRLAMLYLLGLGVPVNKAMAIDYLYRGAEMGDDWSQVHLARIYERASESPAGAPTDPPTPTGADPAKTTDAALRFYGRAADSGNREAAFRLGRMYEQGKGVQQDYSKALNYYQKSALRGLLAGQVALGSLYERGLGTESNYVYAYTFYGLAARHDDASANQHLQSLSRLMTADQRQQAETMIDKIQQQRLANQQVH
jgi:TPR repeat protein